MRARLRSWWQQIKTHSVAIATVLMVLFVVIWALLFLGGYKLNWNWTGFNHPSRTLWDWLNLLGLIATPAVVAFGVTWFTAWQGKVAEAGNKDNQRENALQAYIDKMSELLLHEMLRDSAEEDEVRKIARVQTLTVLRRLDPIRKASVIQFLHESGLIERDNSIISLRDANLNQADLSWAILKEANLNLVNLVSANLRCATLKGIGLVSADLGKVDLRAASLNQANLSGANLYQADLSDADLSRAYLNQVNLSNADLKGADLHKAILVGADLSNANLKGATGITPEELEKQVTMLNRATMPDGSIHP